MVAVAHAESFIHNKEDVENLDPKTSMVPYDTVVSSITKLNHTYQAQKRRQHNIELAVDAVTSKTIVNADRIECEEDDSDSSPPSNQTAELEEELEDIEVDQTDNFKRDKEEERLAMEEKRDLKIADEAPMGKNDSQILQGQVGL